ncbi:hypothetical protein Pla52o_45130 [Novipirellula galeiformis]|uniref:Uncharacterized protein n=1 Tax=Novipirellula galeiformis TaxID=2528004 RepID=A0A5C6C974_9BACT|nr:hypothetical protein Pla52o_45130 [Novipirellula galeiformis]
MAERPTIETAHAWRPSTLALWFLFIVSITSLGLLCYFRHNIWLILAALTVVVVWTVTGRRWFLRGFHQAFDMLAMFAYLSAIFALGIAAYRLWG